MNSANRNKPKVRRPISVLLYVLGGMCLSLCYLAFIQDMFHEASILWLVAFLGIGMAALIDSRPI